MEVQRLLFLLSISSTYVSCAVIPNKSLVMSTHSKSLFVFSGLEDWVNNGVINTNAFINIRSEALNNSRGISFIHRENRQIIVFSDAGLTHISAINVSSSIQQATIFHIGTSSGTYNSLLNKISQTAVALDYLDTFGITNVNENKGVGELAVDWVSGNCYWVDTVYGWIVMQAIPKNIGNFNSKNPNFKMVVDTYLDIPTGIAVYPEMGYLFWTDTGKIPKIERSSLNGDDRKLLSWQGVIRPTSLCIDYSKDRLYWTDPGRGTVEYTDLHGNGRKILVSSPGSLFYGINIFQGKLVVSDVTNDPVNSSIKLFSMADGKQAGPNITLGISIFSLAVFDERRQPLDSSQRCDTIKCEQLCIERPNSTGADCACEDGFTLELDGKTCKAETQVLQRKIVYTDTNKICFVSINSITSHQYLDPEVDCTVVNSTNNITRFTIDTHNRTFYFTDGRKIYIQKAFAINGSQNVYSTNGDIIDLAYDWITGAVYWFEWDANGGVCYKKTDPASTRQKITNTTTKPITMAFDPYTQKLFWMASDNMDSRIKLYTTSSYGKTVSISSPIIKTPTDLEYDSWTDRLFWTDDGFMGQMKSDGTSESKIDLDITRKYHCLTVFKNYTIIGYSVPNRPTESGFTVVQEGKPLTKINFQLPNMTRVDEVKVYAQQLNEIEPCEKNNGGCEQICLPGERTTCGCYVGYTLNEDGKNCRTVVMVKEFILAIDSIDHKAYQIHISGKSINALKMVKGNVPSSIDFDPTNQRIVWIDTDERRIHHFKLSDMAVRAEKKDDITQYSHVVVDVSTGNFYVTLNNTIAVINPQFDVKTLITTTTTPGRLKVFSKLRQMVWVEGSKIRKAKMDGTAANDFVTQGISTPSDIAFDYEDEALYWSDRTLDKIVRIELRQAESNDIISRTGEYPNNIYVAGQYLYYTSYINSRAVYRRDKMPGGKEYTVIFDSPLVGGLASLFVYLVPNQEPCEENNGRCEQICLPGERTTCSCYVGYTLNKDGMTCSTALNLYIIIGSAAGGGGLLLVVIIIIIVVVYYRRRRSEPQRIDNSQHLRRYRSQLPVPPPPEDGYSLPIGDGANGQEPVYLELSESVHDGYLTSSIAGSLREGPNDLRVSHPEEDEHGYLRSSNEHLHRYTSSGRSDVSTRYQPWDMMQHQARGNFSLQTTNPVRYCPDDRTSRFEGQQRY